MAERSDDYGYKSILVRRKGVWEGMSIHCKNRTAYSNGEEAQEVV
jgi:hypothetical protein